MKRDKIFWTIFGMFLVGFIADWASTLWAVLKAGHYDHELNPFVAMMGARGWWVMLGLTLLIMVVLYFYLPKLLETPSTAFFLCTFAVWSLAIIMVVVLGNINAGLNPPTQEEVQEVLPNAEAKVDAFFKGKGMVYTIPLLLSMITYYVFLLGFDIKRKGGGEW
jgi:hypothetical protein|tara:strand:+ start:9884 stop:10375 length:492 start_codon:yes stop_codon:yes gene_type:complete